MRKVWTAVFIVILLACAVPALAQSNVSATPDPQTRSVKNLLMPSSPVDEDILFIGKPSPVWVLPDLNNEYHFLRYYCGEPLKRNFKIKNQTKKVVVMSFFASFCEPCRYEIPHLEKIRQEMADSGVVFFLVNVGEDRTTVEEYLRQYQIAMPVLLDRYQKVSQGYNVTTLPRLILIDRNGIIRGYKIGYSREEPFEELLRSAILTLLRE